MPPDAVLILAGAALGVIALVAWVAYGPPRKDRGKVSNLPWID